MVFTLDVKIKGLKEFRTLTRNFPKATIRLNKSVREKLANTLIEEMRKQLTEKNKVATGTLYEDIYSRSFSKGQFEGQTKVYFGKPRSRYAVFVDGGFMNKRMPPVGGTYGIYRWVQAKNLEIKPKYRKYGKKSKTPGKIYGKPYIPTQEQTAYSIARSFINKRHTGAQIVRKAFSKTKAKMDRIIEEEVNKVLRASGID